MENFKKEPIKGYKVFNPDFTAKERGFQYAENTEYKHEGKIKICNSGFHFCIKAQHCFSYYDFKPENIVCEVEALGETDTHEQDSKVCTNHIRIGKRLSWQEVLLISNDGINNTGHSNSGNRNSGDSNSGNSNSGNRNSGDSNSGNRNSGDSNSGNSNSGYRNSGDSNSGDRNSGDSNSGNWNSGNRNSGDSNSGYRNSGAFCLDVNPFLNLFDKSTTIRVRDWEQMEVCNLMYNIDTTLWIPTSMMTEEEKKINPKYEAPEGYLKTIPIKEAWQNMWHNLIDSKKKLFTSLPNFDAKIFEEITGIKTN